MMSKEMVNIKLEGNACLEKSIFIGDAYYIRLFLDAQEEKSNLYHSERLSFKVGIPKAQYEELDRKLKESKADESILNVSGNLEVKLEPVL